MTRRTVVERIWLSSYPPDVPADIDADAYASLVEVLEESCVRFGHRPAFSNLGKQLSYGELDRLSHAFGAWLQREAGLTPGDRVAIMMPNLLQYPVVLFGCLRAGLTVVNVNPLYTARELRHQLRDSAADTLVVLENFAHVVQEVMAETPLRRVVVTALGDLLPAPKRWLVNAVVRHVRHMVPDWQIGGAIGFRETLARGRGHTLSKPALRGSDIAFLQYTGGTTGEAKGAILTHRNMVANLEQASAWLRGHVREGEEVIITALPLYHIFSLLANCLTFMKLGGENVLITNPRDLPAFIKILSQTRFTAMTGVNTLFNALLNNTDFQALDFSSLRLTLGGGMAVQRAVAERWKAVTGNTLLEAYGLTETSPGVCINPTDLPEYNGSVGLPLPSTDIAIRDEAGVELPVGETGELCVRGPQVTQGYWNRPEESAAAFFGSDWFRTGDIARVDERGFVYIVDRKKDMIIVSGFNVYPNEVEDVLASHPDVQEAAVVGVTDDSGGEQVCAYVVSRNPALGEAELIRHCREQLTAYKVPKRIEFRDELPKTNVGKILRRALRDQQRDGGGPR
jgi:long-chain acyl-CoA synthetase